MSRPKIISFTPSLWSLLITNAVVIIIAITQRWDLNTLITIYWLQSLIIGFFTALKIAHAKKPRKERKKGTIIFIGNYGFIHFVFFFILVQPKTITWSAAFLLAIALFTLNHFFSYLKNRKKDQEKTIPALLIFPYARIIPMHLIVIFADTHTIAATIIFLVLKTIADLIMHTQEHHFDYWQTVLN